MTARDIVMSAAGNAGDGKTYVEDVFSTYLYTGVGNLAQTINNGIDLAGKGGMVWLKCRSAATNNVITDTARGVNNLLYTNSANAAVSGNWGVNLFNSSGFGVAGSSDTANNGSGSTYASWTFRKAPKFFDVVTYTGNGVAGRTVSHSLGIAPGMVIVKCTSATSNWAVYHRGMPSAAYYTKLNLTDGQTSDSTVWNSTAPTASVFSVGTSSLTNTNGATYVAYLFAHDTTTDGLIQCGSFTTDSIGNASPVNLGWEPQYVLIRPINNSSWWSVVDSMRGNPVYNGSVSNEAELRPNASTAEGLNYGIAHPTSTGFYSTAGFYNETYIYMAIRRGPMRTPTDGTKVFAPVVATPTTTTTITTNFPVDCTLFSQRNRSVSGATSVFDRLRGSSRTSSVWLDTPLTASESSASYGMGMDSNTSIVDTISGTNWWGVSSSSIYWLFRRAPGFFDVVTYTGNLSTNIISHNLMAVPELIIFKVRSDSLGWYVYSKPTGVTNYMRLDDTGGVGSLSLMTATPTATSFSLNTSASVVNGSGNTYVAYLFASCPGVSKVGSYTGTGSSQTINCGFSAGARFVLIKRTDSMGDWYVWDTARGIVASTDPHLSLNTTAAEVTTDDTIDPDSTGFIVNQVAATNVNVSAATYIYLAIA